MSITPLFTESEIADNIAKLKGAYSALASSHVAEYAVDLAGTQRRAVYRDPEKVLNELKFWQQQRVNNAIGCGPQAIVGRVFRG